MSMKEIICVIFILVITAITFSHSIQNGILIWDDTIHLTENTSVRSLDFPHIKEIFTTTVNDTYNPFVLLTFAIEYKFFQYDPFIYHLNNLLLHLGVTYLIFIFILKFGFNLRIACIGSILFGIHPMHVESVAWITERKDVLYSLFYMLSINCYLDYLKSKSKSKYSKTIFYGFLSMLAKPMALSLPLIFFLLDWYKKRKFTFKLISEKLLHFIYIIPITWITYSKFVRIPGNSFGEGILIWIWSLIFHITKFIYPNILVPIYDLPKPVNIFNFEYLSSILILSLIILCFFKFRKKRLFIFSFLFYFASIFFLLRFDEVDTNIVADRFMYLPSLGFCMLIAYFADYLLYYFKDKNFERKFINIFLILILFALSIKSYNQTKIWNNDVDFWKYVNDNFSGNWLSFNNLGEAYRMQGVNDKAIEMYKKSIIIKPKNPKPYNNMGLAYAKMGKNDLALKYFNKSIQTNSDYKEGFYNRGNYYLKLKEYDLAISDYTRAIKISPDYVIAYNNRGLCYFNKNDYESALKDFDEAKRIDPTHYRSYYNRGNIYRNKKFYDLAVKEYSKAIKINPDFEEAYNNRGFIYKNINELDLAFKDFNKVISLNPDFFLSYYNRADIHRLKKNYRLALADYSKVIDLNPNFAYAYNNRGLVYEALGQYELALEDFTKTIELKPDVAFVYFNKANINQFLGNYDLAFEGYDRAVELDPDYADAYNNRGLTYEAQKKYNLALKDYEKTIFLNPDHFLAYYNLGNVYIAKNEYKKALENFNKSIKINPNYSLSYYRRSFVFKKLGEYEKAWKDILRYKGIDSSIIDNEHVREVVKFLKEKKEI